MYKGNFKFMLYSSCCSDVIQYLILAEEAITRKPIVSTVSLLSFVEIVVKKICNQYDFQLDGSWSLKEILEYKYFAELVNNEILKEFQEVNELGKYLIDYNYDLDDDLIEKHTLNLLKKTYVIAYWFYSSFNLGDCLFEEFKQPSMGYYGYGDDLVENIFNEYRKVKSNQNYKLSSYIKLNQGDFRIRNNEVAEVLGFEKDFITLNDVLNEYELTASQQNAIDSLDRFFSDDTHKIFLLKGFGGTGKTFLTKGITDYFDAREINYVLAAPTGKAAKVIQSKTNKMATTIHKAIYYFKNLDDDLNSNDDTDAFKAYFNIDEHTVRPTNTVFMIDEASMIGNNYQKNEFFKFGSSKLLNDLIKFTNIMDEKYNNKIIFIGDTAQLPPIGMSKSPALDKNYFKEELGIIVNSAELTDVVRQKQESGILINSLRLRKQMVNKAWLNGITLDLNFEDMKSIKENILVDKYIESCSGGGTPDESIIIAYSNEMVDYYNSLVRENLFLNKKQITIGDKVMAVENYRDPDTPIFNGDYGYVKEIDTDTIQRDIKIKTNINDERIEVTVPLRFRKVQLEFSDTNKSFDIETLIFENILYRDIVYANSSFALDIKNYGLSIRDISKIERIALYFDVARRAAKLNIKSDEKKFRIFMTEDPFYNSLKIKFGYAITCHKAQGSEWKNVFLNCNAHNKSSLEYLRWLYTAITRSSKDIYLIKK